MARGKGARKTREGKQIVLSHSTPAEAVKEGNRDSLELGTSLYSGKVTGQLLSVIDLEAFLLFEGHPFHIVLFQKTETMVS